MSKPKISGNSYRDPEDSDRTESLFVSSSSSSDLRPRSNGAFKPILICMNGGRRGTRLKIDQKETIIGRSRGSHFQIDDDGISRFHVKIVYENVGVTQEPAACYVEDLGSRNGTQLNGEFLQKRAILKERDRITIGRTIFGYFLRDEEELLHDDHLYECATRDAVTGLDNRRQLLSHLRHYIALAQRGRSSIILLLLDIDDFKVINDSYGHQIGDEVLRHLGMILTKLVRESDLLARWGGEEFALCLVESSIAKAQSFAERVRQTIVDHPYLGHDLTVKITVSIGISAFRTGDDYDSLFERADRSMYLAKQSGKNRVVVEGCSEEDKRDTREYK